MTVRCIAYVPTAGGWPPGIGEMATIQFDDWIEGPHAVAGVVTGYETASLPGVVLDDLPVDAIIIAVRVEVRPGLSYVVPLQTEGST